LHSFGYIPRSGIAGSYVRSMFSKTQISYQCLPRLYSLSSQVWVSPGSLNILTYSFPRPLCLISYFLPCYSIWYLDSIFFFHLFTCAYIVWVISSPCSLPPPSSPDFPLLPGRTCSALISNFVEEKT
jgi:hypothetical protein